MRLRSASDERCTVKLVHRLRSRYYGRILCYDDVYGSAFDLFGPLFWILLNLVCCTVQINMARRVEVTDAENSWASGN